ncbi:MAG: type II secretion system protein [Cyanobacteria bacterium SIG30]|nr:type II secretion system protein [Cyanobacteria bacterium SIG30]
MVKNNKKAFTLAEILVAMAVIGFLTLMTMTNVVKQLPDIEKARVKRAYSTIEKIVGALINDDNIYPSVTGFRETAAVTTEFGETFGYPLRETKFRDAFKYSLEVIEHDITCELPNGTSNECFMTDDGTVYGIPNTDFLTLNTMGTQNHVPITIYANWDKEEKRSIDNAFYIGVRFDGNIRILHPDVCGTNNEKMHCKTETFLLSDTIKKDYPKKDKKDTK